MGAERHTPPKEADGVSSVRTALIVRNVARVDLADVRGQRAGKAKGICVCIGMSIA